MKYEEVAKVEDSYRKLVCSRAQQQVNKGEGLLERSMYACAIRHVTVRVWLTLFCLRYTLSLHVLSVGAGSRHGKCLRSSVPLLYSLKTVATLFLQSSYGAESDHPQGSYSVVESFPDAYE